MTSHYLFNRQADDTPTHLLYSVQQLYYCQLEYVVIDFSLYPDTIYYLTNITLISTHAVGYYPVHIVPKEVYYRYSVYATPFALSGRFYFIDFGIDLPTCRTISWLSSIATRRLVLDAMVPMCFQRQGL